MTKTQVLTPAGASAREEASTRLAGPLFRHRNAMGIGLALFLLLFPGGRVEPGAWQAALGLALAAAGVALRLWAILQIGGAARKTSSMKAVQIVSWGPYAMVRNPIYLANISVFAGFTFLSGLPWALPLVAGSLWAWYHALVKGEERFLAASFPEEYHAYALETHRWLPQTRWRKRPAGARRYPFLRALKRERAHLLTVAMGVVWFLLLPALVRICCR